MNNIMEFMGLMNSMKQNPVETLAKYGMNIPTNLSNPQDIIQHLLNTGQINQQQVNNAQMMKDSPMFNNFR